MLPPVLVVEKPCTKHVVHDNNLQTNKHRNSFFISYVRICAKEGSTAAVVSTHTHTHPTLKNFFVRPICGGECVDWDSAEKRESCVVLTGIEWNVVEMLISRDLFTIVVVDWDSAEKRESCVVWTGITWWKC